MVSNLDFESSDLSSNLGRTCLRFLSIEMQTNFINKTLLSFLIFLLVIQFYLRFFNYLINRNNQPNVELKIQGKLMKDFWFVG